MPTATGDHGAVRSPGEEHLGLEYDRTENGVLVFVGDDLADSPTGSFADDDEVRLVGDYDEDELQNIEQPD